MSMPVQHSPSRRTPFLLGALVGLVVAAVGVGIFVALTESSGPGGGDLELPDKLDGGWAAVDAKGGSNERAAENAAKTRKYAEKTLGDVLDVPVVTRTYATDGFDRFATVQVFGEAGGPYVPESLADPEVLGIEKPQREAVREGDSVCILSWMTIPEGDEVDPDEDLQAASCQRTEGDLTVRVSSAGGQLDDVVDLVDEAWDQVS